MSDHFSWYSLLPGVDHHNVYVVGSAAVSAGVILFSLAARLALGTGEAAIAPSGHVGLKGLCEVLVEFIDDLARSVIGDHGRIFVPLFGSMFLYILLNNLVGLFPGMLTATSNINAAFSIGLFSFVTYNLLGLKENGVKYLAHFLGPVWWLAWLMLPIELISHCVRPLSLGMRLSVNMTADHLVLGTFLDLIPIYIPIPVIFYGLGTFVSFVQAFVFTLLSMVYVMMATSHDH